MGMISIPGQKFKIPDYSATKTKVHPDHGQSPASIIKKLCKIRKFELRLQICPKAKAKANGRNDY